MELHEKLKELEKLNINFILGDVSCVDGDHIIIVEDVDSKRNITCHLMTLTEFIRYEAVIVNDCYYAALHDQLVSYENSVGVKPEHSLINSFIGLNPNDYSDGGGYDILTQRATTHIEANIDVYLGASCLSIKNNYKHNGLVLYII